MSPQEQGCRQTLWAAPYFSEPVSTLRSSVQCPDDSRLLVIERHDRDVVVLGYGRLKKLLNTSFASKPVMLNSIS